MYKGAKNYMNKVYREDNTHESYRKYGACCKPLPLDS